MPKSILTRVTPATTKQLTTVDALKAEIGDTTSTRDAVYSRIIDYCSNEISIYLNEGAGDDGDITIGRETLSQTFYGAEWQCELVLARSPVGDITSVTEDGETIDAMVDGSANPAFPYVVKKQSGILWKLSTGNLIPFTGRQITVVYTAGWALPGVSGRNLPDAIEDACLRFCRAKLSEIDDGQDLAGPLTGATIDKIGSFQFGTPAGAKGNGLPYDVRNLIERFKAPTLA